MILLNKDFIKPGKQARLLSILDSLSHNSTLSQQELGKRASLSSTMVNKYLNEMSGQGLVEFEPISGKSYQYMLTESGQNSRRKMLSDYCCEIVHMYSALKQSILDTISPLAAKGIKDLAFFGASETCEVALSALKDTNLSVLAIVDNDPSKHGQLYHGHIVSSPHVLDSIKCQAIVITSFGHFDEIRAQIMPIIENKDIEVVRL